MEKECKFSYNDVDDSFILSCKDENENIKENFMLDDIIFYLTGRGKIVGLQIKNFSQLLLDLGLSELSLKELKKVNLIVMPKVNCLFVGLNLISINGEKKVPIGRVFVPQLLAR